MDSVWLGMTEVQCGMSAVPMYVTRLGDLIEKSAQESFMIFTDNVAFVPRCPLR